MSQENIATLSSLMGDLITGSSASVGFAAMYPNDEELMIKSLEASRAITRLLAALREQLIKEGKPEEPGKH